MSRQEMDLSCIREDALYAIAVRLLPSRRDIDAMRAVCRHWRTVLPPTRGPWVVLAPRNPDLPTIFLAMYEGLFVHEHPLFAPPPGGTCWSCCRGIMLLRYMHNMTASYFCVNCGREDPMLYPHGITWTNFSDTPHLLCAVSPAQPILWWATAFAHIWQEFDFHQELLPRSLLWVDGVCYIAAAPLSLVIDEHFDQRVPPPDELEEVYYDVGAQYAPLPFRILEVLLDDDDQAIFMPWAQRGPHVFNIGSDIYVCVLLHHMGDQHVEVRLFSLEGDNLNNYFLVPCGDIGGHSVFLGSNQAFAVLSTPRMRANTVYVIDDDGIPSPRVLAIDIFTGQHTVFDYPPDIGNLASFMPAGWLLPLPDEEDIDWHCA